MIGRYSSSKTVPNSVLGSHLAVKTLNVLMAVHKDPGRRKTKRTNKGKRQKREGMMKRSAECLTAVLKNNYFGFAERLLTA